MRRVVLRNAQPRTVRSLLGETAAFLSIRARMSKSASVSRPCTELLVSMLRLYITHKKVSSFPRRCSAVWKWRKKNKKFRTEQQKLRDSEYLTRTQALAKVQLPISDFRRLCILKGIYPRDPSGKRGSSGKIFYHSKDIRHLLHEPVLQTIRNEKIWKRRLRRAIGRKEKHRERVIRSQEPIFNLFPLVRERYPTLMDCARDLDDCISSVALFASMPAKESEAISPDLIANCVRLLDEFLFWGVARRTLRKVFCSIKGFYLQFSYLQQLITVLIPHQFPQDLPAEVDYGVMKAYLEIYGATLQAFCLKAYKEEGLQYPPTVNVAGLRSGLRWLALSSVGDRGITGHALMEDQRCTLFANKTFFFGREVPRTVVTMMVKACGAEAVGWEGSFSPFGIDYKQITHHVLDRPVDQALQNTLATLKDQREFVQPQWIFDSINNGMCLSPSAYQPGLLPPPHLSPFVEAPIQNATEFTAVSAEEQEAALEHDETDEGDEDFDVAATGETYAAGLAAEIQGNKTAPVEEIKAKLALKKKKREEHKATQEHQRRVAALTAKKRVKYNRAVGKPPWSSAI